MADPKEEYLTFEQALEALKLKEEELKRLVSEGEIRAFRQGDTMRLRRADVDNLKTDLSGGEVVDLGEAGEELVFEDERLAPEAGMATEEIAEVETIIDEAEAGQQAEPEGGEDEGSAGEPARTGSPVRRTAAKDEGIKEGAGVLFCSIAASFLLILSAAVIISISHGHAGGLAGGLASFLGGLLGSAAQP